MAITREFIFEKATKNTFRYQEVVDKTEGEEEAAVVGTIYVQKWAFPAQPSRIRVTVEEA